jgi:hypothetical protein
MTNPATPARATTATRVITAVKVAHESPLAIPRHIAGWTMFFVGVGLLVWHFVAHHGPEKDLNELKAAAGLIAGGLLLIPGVPEGLTAGIKGVGGAAVDVFKRYKSKDAAP